MNTVVALITTIHGTMLDYAIVGVGGMSLVAMTMLYWLLFREH